MVIKDALQSQLKMITKKEILNKLSTIIVVKVVKEKVEEITILINDNDTMKEQNIEVEDIQIDMTSLKLNAIDVISMVTIINIISLIFNTIATKNWVII